MQRFWSRLGCLTLLVLSVGLSPLSAQQSHQTMPSAARSTFNTELQNYLLLEAGNRQKDAGGDGFVVSGGVHATAGSMTSASFATVAYSNNGHYISQSSAAIDYSAAGCSSSDTGWVVVAETASGAIGGNFSRVGTTRYAVNCTDTSQPSLPSGTTWLMKVTIAGSAITQVVNLGLPARPLDRITSDVYNVLQHGLTGDCSTNDAAALQHLADTMPNGSTLYFPQTTAGCYLFGTTRINIKKDVTVLCQGWQTYLSWDTESASDPGCPDGMECEYGGLNIHHDDMVDGTYLNRAAVLGCHMQFGGARGNTYQLWKRGLNIYQANNVYIEGNLFQNVTGEVIGIGNWGSTTKGSRSWVINNLLINFAQAGINPNNSENTIAGNRFRTGTLAVEMGGSGTIASYNEAFDLTTQMFAVQTTNGQIVHNVCRTCYSSNPASTDGVITVNDRGNCSGTTDVLIAHNVLVNASAPANAAGITVYNSGVACSPNRNARVHVQNNHVGQAFQTGIYIEQDDDCLVTGNTVHGAVTALAITTGSGKVQRCYFADNRLGGSSNTIQDQSVFADGNLVGFNAVYTGSTGALRARWGSTARAWTDGDTTPSVRGDFIWSAGYTGATNVTGVDDVEPLAPPVCVRFTNSNITLIDSGTFQMPGGVNLNPGANDVYCFFNDGGGVVYVTGGSNN